MNATDVDQHDSDVDQNNNVEEDAAPPAAQAVPAAAAAAAPKSASWSQSFRTFASTKYTRKGSTEEVVGNRMVCLVKMPNGMQCTYHCAPSGAVCFNTHLEKEHKITANNAQSKKHLIFPVKSSSGSKSNLANCSTPAMSPGAM